MGEPAHHKRRRTDALFRLQPRRRAGGHRHLALPPVEERRLEQGREPGFQRQHLRQREVSLSRCGRTLYFLSDGWQGFGGYDIYFTNLADVHGNRPTNLGLPINTEDDEICFGVSADGRYGYFSGRTADSRSSDVLMFELYPAARPEAMRRCRMKVNSPSGSRDTVFMLSEKTPSVVTVADEGMLPVILCRRAQQMPAAVTLNDTLVPLAVTFMTGSRLTVEGESVVDALAAWLVQHPRVHLAIECPKYTEAKMVYDQLKNKGLRSERLEYRFGSEYTRPQIRRTQ